MNSYVSSKTGWKQLLLRPLETSKGQIISAHANNWHTACSLKTHLPTQVCIITSDVKIFSFPESIIGLFKTNKENWLSFVTSQHPRYQQCAAHHDGGIGGGWGWQLKSPLSNLMCQVVTDANCYSSSPPLHWLTAGESDRPRSAK